MERITNISKDQNIIKVGQEGDEKSGRSYLASEMRRYCLYISGRGIA